MSKVKEFCGYQVPEGATHYNSQSNGWHEGFYKYKDGCFLFCNAGFNEWTGSHAEMKLLPEGCVELPDQPPSEPEQTKEWEPTIGDKIVVDFKGHTAGLSESEASIDSSEVTFIKTVDSINGSRFFVVESGFTVHVFRSHFFRELKTEKEKKLEVFAHKVLEVYMDSEASINDSDLNVLIDKLFEAGCEFTAPEGE